MDDCVGEGDGLLSPRDLRLAKRDLDLLAKKDTGKETLKKNEEIESSKKKIGDDEKEAQEEEKQTDDQLVCHLPISAADGVAPSTEEATLLITTIIHE